MDILECFHIGKQKATYVVAMGNSMKLSNVEGVYSVSARMDGRYISNETFSSKDEACKAAANLRECGCYDDIVITRYYFKGEKALPRIVSFIPFNPHASGDTY